MERTEDEIKVVAALLALSREPIVFERASLPKIVKRKKSYRAQQAFESRCEEACGQSLLSPAPSASILLPLQINRNYLSSGHPISTQMSYSNLVVRNPSTTMRGSGIDSVAVSSSNRVGNIAYNSVTSDHNYDKKAYTYEEQHILSEVSRMASQKKRVLEDTTTSENDNKHMRIDIQHQKCFQCIICKQKFKSDILKSHLWRHGYDQVQFRCASCCTLASADVNGLRKHVNENHRSLLTHR